MMLSLLGFVLYLNGQQVDGTGRIDTTSPAATPTPTVSPTPTPTAQLGVCPAGYEALTQPITTLRNAWGLGYVDVPKGETRRYCALVGLVSRDEEDQDGHGVWRAAPTQRVSFFTADRTGAEQCSNVTLTVRPPDGREPLHSQAVNNTVRVYGLHPPDYLAPTGAYLIELFGGQPRPPCTTQAVMVYWQVP